MRSKLPANSRRRLKSTVNNRASGFGLGSLYFVLCTLYLDVYKDQSTKTKDQVLPPQQLHNVRVQQHYIRGLLQREKVVLLKLTSGFGRRQQCLRTLD